MHATLKRRIERLEDSEVVRLDRSRPGRERLSEEALA